jgi:hypothetical protein
MLRAATSSPNRLRPVNPLSKRALKPDVPGCAHSHLSQPGRAHLYFLLNDVVLRLETHDLAPPLREAQFASLSFEFIDRLGKELFAEEPMLQSTSPARAMRLAALIIARCPEINAALFVAPRTNCEPAEVQSRFVGVGLEIMGLLHERQQSGTLTNVVADRQVWRRLAA